MDDLANTTITTGGLITGFLALPYLIYRVYQGLKSDRKGDDVDARISDFTTKLQAQLDKALAKSDTLQTSYNSLVVDLAKAQARTESLAAENQILRDQLQQLRQTAGSLGK